MPTKSNDDVVSRRLKPFLHQWGQWAGKTERTCGLRQSDSPAYAMMKQKMQQTSKRRGYIRPDDEMLMVDRLCAMLKQSRPDLYQWIRAVYLEGYSVGALEKATKVSRAKIEQYIIAGETWLDCKLECLSETL